MLTIKPDKVFLKRANKLLKGNPGFRTSFIELYDKLSADPFGPTLDTHPLTGNLKGVVFRLYDDIVHLLDIGSHDEVY